MIRRTLAACLMAAALPLAAHAGPADGPTSLVAIPGGDFVTPGSNDGLTLHVDSFQLERTPVTWAQYKRAMRGTPHWTALIAEHEKDYPPDAPVVYVTWDNAAAYAATVGRRLPTEVEWEYAAAAGRKVVSQQYTEDEKQQLHWYGGAKKEPKPVGQGKPNAYGIHDLHGNVWEWVEEVRGSYGRKDSRDPTSGTDSLGCGNTTSNEGSYAWFLRASVRAAATKDQAMRFRGFRCAL
jgi:formylglycine-generating enzyme required for sulfatase activity